MRSWVACLVVGSVLVAGTARAQQPFAVNRFEPSDMGSDWLVLDSLDFRSDRDAFGNHLAVFPAIGVVSDYNFRSLGVYDPDGTLRTPVVDNQWLLHVGATVTLLDRVRVGLDMPFELFSDGSPATARGQTFEPPASAQALGDLRLGADVRLYGEYGKPFTLAVGAQVWVPTGDQASYMSDGTARIAGRVQAAGDVGPVAYAARLALEFRGLEQTYVGSETAALGSELQGGLAVGLRALDKKLLVGPEVDASTVVTEGAWFTKQATPVEGLLGAHYHLGDFLIGAGVGAGLTRGLGAPEVRGIFSFEWAPVWNAPKDSDGDHVLDEVDACPSVPGVPTNDPRTNGCPPDEDHDGVPDKEDACPSIAGVRSPNPHENGCPPDADHDGVFDRDDACPNVAGVRSADPKKNGCPPDADGDGIPDAKDACPTVAGVESPDPKKNGCPPDRDGDGVPDAQDACPDEVGVHSTNPKFDGCPPDEDHDGIPNEEDACPTEPGKPDPDPKKNGCPKAYIQGGEIKITDQVKFRTASAAIVPGKDSEEVLQAVLKVIKDHPEIKKIRIEGHTDNVGGAEYNKKLSAERAASVRKWLVRHGIAGDRLESQGFGFERPLVPNDTADGRRQNRRVEFHIEEKQP